MPSSELPVAAPTAPAAAAIAIGRPHAPRDCWWRFASWLRAQFWLKTVGITAFMWLFFVGYFHLLREPVRPPIEMPLTPVDRWIGIHDWALWPYLSLWAYVVMPPALMPTARKLIRYGWWVGALCVAGLACFYWWPTAVPPQLMAEGHAGFDLLRGVDAAGNACPSMHVATACFSALWIDRLLRDLAMPRPLRTANLCWFLLIVWSTLAIKQHVWWDVVAGLMLALAIGLPSLRGWGEQRRGDKMQPR
jgi:hypothetical protein